MHYVCQYLNFLPLHTNSHQLSYFLKDIQGESSDAGTLLFSKLWFSHSHRASLMNDSLAKQSEAAEKLADNRTSDPEIYLFISED